MPTAAAIAKKDTERLKYVCLTFLNVSATNYEDQDVPKALEAAGVEGFNADFIGLSEADILALEVPSTTTSPPKKLQLVKYRKLIQILAYFHDRSRLKDQAIDISTVNITAFNNFAVGLYRPDQPIVPFGVAKTQTDDTDLDNWRKHVKPNGKDFKDFKDEYSWDKAKEQIMITLDAQNLSHLIDPNHVPTNARLDKAQSTWLFKVFTDIMIAPRAKSIVKKHKVDKDCRQLWEDLEEAFDNSMSNVYYTQKLSTYLTSARLKDISWNGKTENFIHHWQEIARKHDDAATEPFSSGMKVQFLNACVAGFEPLASVLNIRDTASRAAGITTPITFDEYVQRLAAAAQTYDAGNTGRKNPRVSRQVNMSELIFDDDDALTPTSYEVDVHDMDTPVESLLVNQNEQGRFGPRKVMMGKSTWISLSKQDQDNWDSVSEDGKSKILGYVENRQSNNGQRPNNNNRSTRFSNNNGYRNNSPPAARSINTHEVGVETEDRESNTQISVSVHDLHQEKDLISFDDEPQVSGNNKTNGYLHMATHKTPMSANIARLMSKPKSSTQTGKAPNGTPSLEVSMHDYVPRSENTIYEVNMHAFDDDDGVQVLDEVLSDEDPNEEEVQVLVTSSRSADAQEGEVMRSHNNEDAEAGLGDVLIEELSEEDEQEDPNTSPDQDESDPEDDGPPPLEDTALESKVAEREDPFGLLRMDESESDPESPNDPEQQVTFGMTCGEIVQQEMEALGLESEAIAPRMKEPFSHVSKPFPTMKDRVKDKHDGTGHYLAPDPRSKRSSKSKKTHAVEIKDLLDDDPDLQVNPGDVDPWLQFAVSPPVVEPPPVKKKLDTEQAWSVVASKQRRKPVPSLDIKRRNLQKLPTKKERKFQKAKKLKPVSTKFCETILSPFKDVPESSSSDSNESSSAPSSTSADTHSENPPAADQDFQRAKSD